MKTRASWAVVIVCGMSLSLAVPSTLSGRNARVVAHELGHLLLSTNSHSRAGLMRRQWSNEDLRIERRNEFTFTPQEAKKLRADLENRTRRAAPIQLDQPAAQINIELKNGFVILARGSIGRSNNLVFVVDTGTSRTIVDARIAEQLHLESIPYRLTVLDHDADAKLVELPSLRLGPIYAESPKVIAMDLSDAARRFGIHADAIVGMDILRQRSFTIDYESRQIGFDSEEVLRHSVQLEHQGDPYFVVEARINGRVVHLMVDTGFDGLVLFSDHLPKEQQRSRVEIERNASSAAGQVSLREAPLAKVKIGDSNARKVSPLVVETGGRDIGTFAGILGARVLQTSRIRFDLERNTLSWK